MQIFPFEGLGDLRFGSGRNSVRSQLLGEPQSFQKAPEVGTTTDSYDMLGFHLYYDSGDRLDFIEVFPPCDPIFSDIHLLDGQLNDILMRLENKGYKARFDDAAYFFDELGFALYAPYDELEAVSIFRRGYYDAQV
jgi:hypothetical protein